MYLNSCIPLGMDARHGCGSYEQTCGPMHKVSVLLTADSSKETGSVLEAPSASAAITHGQRCYELDSYWGT